jgi:AcrR family transcriptional regulator
MAAARKTPLPTVATRERIVTAAADLFRVRGYHGTGMKEVAARSQAQLGSIYHFFPDGKRGVGAAAIVEAGAGFQALVTSVLDGAPDIVQGVSDAFEGAALVLELSDFADACPIATVALEVASTDEVLGIATATVFESWHGAAVERFIVAGVPGVVAHELATLFVAALEGGFLLSRAAKDATPMRTLGRTVTAQVRDAAT